MKIALNQLKSLKKGSVQFSGLRQRRTEPTNVLFVLVSVTNHTHDWRKAFTRSLNKITSIAVFIAGTACFASTQLLSIAMATFVLTCVLGAGVFGRATTSWIVTRIERADPMVHFVADTEQKAHYVLARLFMTRLEGTQCRQVQVELHGHVFLDQKLINSRSPWPSWFLGILATPYDLAKGVDKTTGDEDDLGTLEEGPDGSMQQSLLSGQLTTQSTFGTDTSEPIPLQERTPTRMSTARLNSNSTGYYISSRRQKVVGLSSIGTPNVLWSLLRVVDYSHDYHLR